MTLFSGSAVKWLLYALRNCYGVVFSINILVSPNFLRIYRNPSEMWSYKRRFETKGFKKGQNAS